MAKKVISNDMVDYKKVLEKSSIIKVKVEDEMKKSFIAYAMAVNVSRAIPDVRDGLKPVHRRILFSMGEMGMYSDKPYRKCARIVGDVMGKYHPHGDSAIYDALVRLAQDFSINCPLVDGQGNFGSVDGDPPAASRYTEARLSKISSEMLRDIDKDTVDSYPNFDETLEQPRVLPSRFPNILVNGADGIAVGMATNIPPHNLVEVINGTVAQIDNPDITIEELMQFIPAPDFPTGGIIMGRAGVRSAYKSGRGGLILRAKTEIEEHIVHGQQRSRIVVTELPYQVNKAKLIENIADLVKDKRVEGISDVREESDRQGMRIVIEIKKDANAQVVLNLLFKHTQLQVSSGMIMLALANGQPLVMNLKEIIGHYIEHQKDVIVRRTKFDLQKAEDRCHILEGLVIAQDNIDRVVMIIRSSKDSQEAGMRLMEEFSLSERQTKAILEMQLQRLTHLQIDALHAELKKLYDLITYLKGILESPKKVTDIIKEEMLEISAKYGVPRKSQISMDYGDIDIGDLIDKEDVLISMTHGGYIKRLPVNEYRVQKRRGVGITAHKPKDEDYVVRMFICNTHDDLLFFTNFGRVYSIKAYEIPESQRATRGRAIINLLQLSDGEKVSAIIPKQEGVEGFLFMATKKALVKKTSTQEYSNIRKVGKIAIKLNEGDQLVAVDYTDGEKDILIASRRGKGIRFSEKDVRAVGRDSQGVRSIDLMENDEVVDMVVVDENKQIVTVTEKGYGKRCEVNDFRRQGRAGSGVKVGIFNDDTGNLVNMKQVDENEDLMCIADNGIVIRFKVDDIRKVGRTSIGVRIMTLREDAKIVCVASCIEEEQDD